jgi:hypothetical protein
MCLQRNGNVLTNYLALLTARHKCTPTAKINISRTRRSSQLISKVRHSAALSQVNPLNNFTANFPINNYTASFPKYHLISPVLYVANSLLLSFQKFPIKFCKNILLQGVPRATFISTSFVYSLCQMRSTNCYNA